MATQTKDNKKKKKMNMELASSNMRNTYYKRKLKQQDIQIKSLQSKVRKLEPIEDKKLSSLILKMQKIITGFLNYIKKNPNPVKIIKYSLKGDRPLYLGAFGIIVYSIYLILKQTVDKSTPK
jgi:hypothetical protein